MNEGGGGRERMYSIANFIDIPSAAASSEWPVPTTSDTASGSGSLSCSDLINTYTLI